MAPTIESRNRGVKFFYSPIARVLFTNTWYFLVSKLDKNAEVTLMNYGFAYLDSHKIPLEASDESERYSLQFYDYVANRVPLQGKDVLEVGCGRGGGASYIARYLHPQKMVGVDIVASAIRFDEKRYREEKNLQFLIADAHSLPFEENSFDAVVNIESAQHYADIDRFLREVYRVLRPGGYLLMACFEDPSKNVFPRAALGRSKLHKIQEEDITENVVRALDIDSIRRQALADKLSPKILRGLIVEFAGVKGTKLYNDFASPTSPYLYFVYQK